VRQETLTEVLFKVANTTKAVSYQPTTYLVNNTH